MIVTTLHETIFEYSKPIERTFTEVRVWPVSDAGQTCHEFSLTVDPMRPLSEGRDYYGNNVLTFNILPPHRRVVVSARSVVETHRKPFEPHNDVSPFEAARAQYDYTQFGGPVEYSIDIEKICNETGLRDARPEATWFEEDSVFKALQNLNTYIYERFTYCPDSTNVHTHISEVLELGRGVCQDFAHVFLAVCRAANLPARYASGYLVTRRSRSAEGSSASHAWVEALVPGHGWCAFDPTNNLLANDSYIKMAVGRDYRDVPPTRGVFKGVGVDCRMSVRVHTLVEELLLAEHELIG